MSSFPVLLPEAKTDVMAAYLWYEEQSVGLGKEFLRCVEAALLSVQRNPKLYAIAHKTFRRTLVRRFPFVVFFEEDSAQGLCVVYAVLHCSQDPQKWQRRLV